MRIKETGAWEGETDEYVFFPSLIDALSDITGMDSITDIGCGNGSYVKALREKGIDAIGYDGNYAYSGDYVLVADITDLPKVRKSDWAICIEVGEHIPCQYEDCLYKTLDSANKKGIVLTFAPPEQVGGSGHVNPKYIDEVVLKLNNMGYRKDNEKTKILHECWSKMYPKTGVAVMVRE